MKSAFLVGDAAHQTPPFYGQGMCHGIRDAAQLIWKLRLVVDGETSAAALDSYQAEREPHVREIIAASVAAGAQVCKVDPDEAAARDAEFRRIEAARSSASVAMTDVVPPMRAGILDPASGGMCLPEFVRVAPDGSLRRVDELLAGRFTILSVEDGVECLAGEIAARWRQLNGHEIALGRDFDGSFALWLGRQRARWVIVRPDRYVYATAADQRALCAQLERLFVQLGVRETTDHRWGRKANDNPVIATLKPDSESSMKPLKFSLNHLGLYVIDIDLMTDFYTSFFGFVITDRRDDLNEIRFMTMSPDEHHQLLLAAGRKADSESTVNQVSFLMEDFASLRRLYERATTDKRVRKVWAVDHGNSWTVYFKDPEDNTIECYVHSPWHVSQPYGVPIDFTLSDEQIYRRTEAASLANPTYKTAETYRSELTQRLRERAQ